MHRTHPRGGWDHMMDYRWFGGGFMWLFWIVLLGIIIFFLVNRSKRTIPTAGMTEEKPLDFLKKRYAKGEIDKEEFERLKKDIEA